MTKQIDYYFSMISPWAHMGHAKFMDIVKRNGLTVTFKPVPLTKVFAETGGLPLMQRAPARQRYRMMELQRWREKSGLPFHLRPKFGRFDTALADCFVLAIIAEGHNPEPFVRRAFKAVQEDEMNLADEATLAQLADEQGLPGAKILERAKRDETRAQYEQHYKDAVAVDAIGSPCYVRGGEVFWGQDRLDLFEDAVTSGREPFRSDV
jgi:2-hydroxychromene-2-carboxylate isomerase